MRLVEYPDREMMMIDLANQLAGDLKNALLTHETATLAVPGGTTPGPVFDTLCGTDMHWDRVNIMLTDERWVPETSERSNTRLLRERLMVDRAAMAHVVPLYREAETPEDVLDELIAALVPNLPISVLLLGMGADGHTASLFPGADNLEAGLADGAPALMAMRAPGAPEPRVTLTAPVLNGALAKHVLITGSEKREALERARHATRQDAPIRAVWGDAIVHWAE
ncbi:MAG: 6-phosphogluconolactonase [Pseudomonadota bacterium]